VRNVCQAEVFENPMDGSLLCCAAAGCHA
jgi:hypothetical protein